MNSPQQKNFEKREKQRQKVVRKVKIKMTLGDLQGPLR